MIFPPEIVVEARIPEFRADIVRVIGWFPIGVTDMHHG